MTLFGLLWYRLWLVQTGVRLRRETQEWHKWLVTLDGERGAQAYLDIEKGMTLFEDAVSESNGAEVRTDTSNASVHGRGNLDFGMQEVGDPVAE